MLHILISTHVRYPANVKALRKRVKDTLLDHSVTQAEVSVALVGERKMRMLGQKYLGETKSNPVHEVLSFPQGDGSALGDIVICYPEARKIAIRKNRMMDDVIGELAEHATLHLLGIHHE